jgi:hypothetical protein
LLASGNKEDTAIRCCVASFDAKDGRLTTQSPVVDTGVLLTPVAAMLAFVDPGLTKDADCAALLAQARTGGK